MEWNGGPNGGKGLEERETELGVARYDGDEDEVWLDDMDGGLNAVAMDCFSADSRALGRATGFLLGVGCASDSVCVKVRVK